VGELYLKKGDLAAAGRAFRHASFLYPDYPHAVAGQAKVSIAEGDRDGGLAILLGAFKRVRTLDLASRIGDLYAERGDAAEAERYYRLANDLAGPDVAQTEPALALFLAEHGRDVARAVQIAERVATLRHDIFTEDALAWAYYKVGRIGDAAGAIERAQRTGSRDPRIEAHAQAIRAALAARAGG
jgi:tetratricopeptide (TPR) repeat protein